MKGFYLILLLVCCHSCSVQRQKHSAEHERIDLQEFRADSLHLTQHRSERREGILKIRHVEWIPHDTLPGTFPDIKSITWIDMEEKREEDVNFRRTEDKRVETHQDIQTWVESEKKMRSGISFLPFIGIFLAGVLVFIVIYRFYYNSR